MPPSTGRMPFTGRSLFGWAAGLLVQVTHFFWALDFCDGSSFKHRLSCGLEQQLSMMRMLSRCNPDLFDGSLTVDRVTSEPVA